MKRYLREQARRGFRRVYRYATSVGLDPIRSYRVAHSYPRYWDQLKQLRLSIEAAKQSGHEGGLVVALGKMDPILWEFSSSAGIAGGHYFHQDLLVANLIYRARPEVHLDIGSRVDGFIAHLLAFEQNTILGDIRPLSAELDHLSFLQIDLTTDAPLLLNGQTFPSISSLHAIEHMGLGRYGDPIDALGHYKALANLKRLLAPQGKLYLSYPTASSSRIEYNSQRVISLAESKEMFERFGLRVSAFSYVDDQGDLQRDLDPEGIDYEGSYGLNGGCAIWTLVHA